MISARRLSSPPPSLSHGWRMGLFSFSASEFHHAAPVMNSPAYAEARDWIHAAPSSADHDARGRGYDRHVVVDGGLARNCHQANSYPLQTENANGRGPMEGPGLQGPLS